jgi:cob(I)alamin adenosyltransferase
MSEQTNTVEIKEAPKSTIYTRTGDRGTTALYNGARVKKTNAIINSVGELDELSAHLAFAVALLKKSADFLWLNESQLSMSKKRAIEFISDSIMPTLMDIGSHIATPMTSSSDAKISRVAFNANQLELLEKEINQVDHKLPKLKNFVLLLGNTLSTQIHICRTICRRAERTMSKLMATEDVDENVFKYVNRLSSYLFVLARYLVHVIDKQDEIIYCKKD